MTTPIAYKDNVVEPDFLENPSSFPEINDSEGLIPFYFQCAQEYLREGKEIPTALFWLGKGAELKHIESMLEIAKIYENHLRPEYSPVDAIKWYHNAITLTLKKNNEDRCSNYNTPANVELITNLKKTFKVPLTVNDHLSREIKNSHTVIDLTNQDPIPLACQEAICKILTFYNNDIRYDPLPTFELLDLGEKAANSGHVQSMVEVGKLYVKTCDGKRDGVALTHFWTAAFQGSSEATFLVGWMSENEKGVSEGGKVKELFHSAFYKKAARMGNEAAKIALERIALELSTSSSSNDKAI